MGWVSYMEDVRDRLDADLRDMQRQVLLVGPKRAVPKQERKKSASSVSKMQPQVTKQASIAPPVLIRKTIGLIERTKADIDAIIELMTDDSFDSVMYMIDLRREISGLQRRLAESQKRSELLKQRCAETESRLKKEYLTLLNERDLRIARLENLIGGRPATNRGRRLRPK